MLNEKYKKKKDYNFLFIGQNGALEGKDGNIFLASEFDVLLDYIIDEYNRKGLHLTSHIANPCRRLAELIMKTTYPDNDLSKLFNSTSGVYKFLNSYSHGIPMFDKQSIPIKKYVKDFLEELSKNNKRIKNRLGNTDIFT